MSTLTYGIELCNLTDGLLNILNLEGRKGLTTLFNNSVHSRNYLNTLLNIEHISSIIITNKLNLLTRLNNKKTGNIILQMLEKANYSCFITDIHNITSNLDRPYQNDHYRKYPKVHAVFEPIEERVLQELTECLSMWNIQENRTRFTNILEEYVWNR